MDTSRTVVVALDFAWAILDIRGGGDSASVAAAVGGGTFVFFLDDRLAFPIVEMIAPTKKQREFWNACARSPSFVQSYFFLLPLKVNAPLNLRKKRSTCGILTYPYKNLNRCRNHLR
tara:strand:- start:964 stop:1314 length:351 start_codon:yes stop_codon:yes gene_type:complete